jgi:hypothetical protein
MAYESTMESATKAWQARPRSHGPDLFSIAGYTIPEFLTRDRAGYVADGGEIEDDDEGAFEKVDQKYATAHDFYADTMIKLRKAAQASAAANAQAICLDEIRRRAGGKMDMPLRELIDPAT